MATVLRKREETPEKKKKETKISKEEDESGRSVGKRAAPKGVRIPGAVLGKLIIFSMLAIALPIFVFYYTLQYYGTTYAGVWAAVSANFVLIMYIIIAYLEGEDDEKKVE